MADRFYINTTNLVTFAAGERPSADKFNAVNKYFSRGLESLARVIGDAHDDGAPHGLAQSIYLTNKWNRSSGTERPLDILNLARLIGPASNLNPRYLNRSDSRTIQETIPAGVLEYYPNFPIESLSTVIPDSSLIQPEGFIRFESNTTEDIQFEYIFKPGQDIQGGPNYIDAEFNVIPDPNTVSGNQYSLTITEDNISGGYFIELPLNKYQQSKLLNLNDSNLDSSDPNDTAQLELPVWMHSFQNGQIIPQGCIYLKDRTTGESFIDGVYTYISETEINVSNVELCLTEDHTFCLVTAGTDITTSIDDIRTKLFMHKHDGSFGESRISIYDLKDVFKYAPPSGAYKKSELAWNAVPQYLHRDGWQEGQDSFNGDNGMRGPLMMNLTSELGVSNSIYFGEINKSIKSTGNYLSIQSSSNELVQDRGIRIAATGDQTNSNGIEITSATSINTLANVKVNNNNCQKYYFNSINQINQDDIFSEENKNIIENTGSFKKTVLEDQHLLFDISLEELESLLGITFNATADALSGYVNGEWKVIFAKNSTQNILLVDINFFKNIDTSNIKDLYKYLVNDEDAEIDFLDYKGTLSNSNEKVLLSLSSKNPNAKYRLDLRTKTYTVNVNGVDYDYQVNLFNKIFIESSSPLVVTQQPQESLYLIIDRFKNYYNLVESETCSYESTFEIFLQRDPAVSKAPSYIFFNYNGHIQNGEYSGPFYGYEADQDSANKILVEKIFIELDDNSSVLAAFNNSSSDNELAYIRINNPSEKMKLICKEYFDHNLKQVVLKIKAVEDNPGNNPRVYSRPSI